MNTKYNAASHTSVESQLEAPNSTIKRAKLSVDEPSGSTFATPPILAFVFLFTGKYDRVKLRAISKATNDTINYCIQHLKFNIDTPLYVITNITVRMPNLVELNVDQVKCINDYSLKHIIEKSYNVKKISARYCEKLTRNALLLLSKSRTIDFVGCWRFARPNRQNSAGQCLEQQLIALQKNPKGSVEGFQIANSFLSENLRLSVDHDINVKKSILAAYFLLLNCKIFKIKPVDSSFHYQTFLVSSKNRYNQPTFLIWKLEKDTNVSSQTQGCWMTTTVHIVAAALGISLNFPDTLTNSLE